MRERAAILLLFAGFPGLSCRGGDEKQSPEERAAASTARRTPDAFEAAVSELGKKPWDEAFVVLEQRFGSPHTLPFREVFPDVVQDMKAKGQPLPGGLVHTWSAAGREGDATCVRLTAIAGPSPTTQLAVQKLPPDPKGPLNLAYRSCLADVKAARRAP